MRSSISVIDKKEFLKWFTKNFVLKRREALWILDYLYNHNIMLEKTSFVENVKETPRGIYMSVQGNHNVAFRFYKNGHTFKDAMQAFHEVRLNWSSPLYIEIDFQNAWEFPEYLAILEDNPYARWNDEVSDDVIQEIDEALTYESLLYARKLILQEIDELLVKGSKQQFDERTENLREIERQIAEAITNDQL